MAGEFETEEVWSLTLGQQTGLERDQTTCPQPPTPITCAWGHALGRYGKLKADSCRLTGAFLTSDNRKPGLDERDADIGLHGDIVGTEEVRVTKGPRGCGATAS